MNYEDFSKSCTPSSFKYINESSDEFKYNNAAEKASSFLHVIENDQKQIDQLLEAVRECDSYEDNFE